METWQRDRDEDLTLFHDMRARERKNSMCFLNDDIEASLSTNFGETSGYGVLATSPMRKARSDLFLLDPEKSAYDWLLTPPGTPLFPSLNQDVPTVHLSHGLGQPAFLSRSSRLSSPQEPPAVFHRHPKPYQGSTASSACSTTCTSKGRPSPSLTSPTSRLSPPPCRPTMPAGMTSEKASRSTSRCSTQTLRRMNTSPDIGSSSASKVDYAKGKIRGKSLSPKIQRLENSLTDFSETPPNLRTSLSDCSILRGKSLGSRYGGTARYSNSSLTTPESNKSHRHMTSLGHCLSNSLDHNSCRLSKSSNKISSPWDEGMEFAESIVPCHTRSSSDSICKAEKNASQYENTAIGKCILSAKRQQTRSYGMSGEKKALSNLTSRKRFERQLVQHQSSPNMFRPLLSSAPTSSFYSTRSASKHCWPASIVLESSMSTGSNKVPDWEAKIVPENEISHGLDEEGKKNTIQSGRCLETLSDLGDNDNQKISNFIDSAVSKDQVSDLDHKKMVHNEAKLTISTDNELRKYNEHSPKVGETKDRINSPIVNVSSSDEVERYGHAIKEPRFLASYRQTADAVQHSRGKSDHYSSQEGLPVMSHTGRVRGSNSGCDQGEIFTSSTVEYSVDVVEHSFHSDSRVLQTGGVNSLATTKIPSGEKPCIYKGKDLSMERKEGQGAVLTVDTREFTCTNENSQSSTPSGSLQSGIVDHQHMPLGYLSAECHVKHALEQGPDLSGVDFPKTDLLENYALCNTADNCGHQEGILSLLGVCAMVSDDNLTLQLHNAESDTTTCQKKDMDTEKCHSKLAAAENAEDYELLEDTLCHELDMEDARFLDGLSKKHQSSIPTLMRNVTLEEATDMILFCSSIVHEIAYKAAATAMHIEDYDAAKNSGTEIKRETFFNLSEAMCRNPSHGGIQRAGNRKWQPAGSAVRRTFRYVQKQRMVHQRIPTVTVQENPKGRTENAVMGNNEEILAHTVTKVHKKKSKQARKVKCRCWCCIM